jgi:hypothetical protein
MMGPAELRAGGDFVVPTRRLASSFRRSRCGPGARHHRPASGTTVGRSATCVLSDTVRRAGQDMCSSRSSVRSSLAAAATGSRGAGVPWRRLYGRRRIERRATRVSCQRHRVRQLH